MPLGDLSRHARVEDLSCGGAGRRRGSFGIKKDSYLPRPIVRDGRYWRRGGVVFDLGRPEAGLPQDRAAVGGCAPGAALRAAPRQGVAPGRLGPTALLSRAQRFDPQNSGASDAGPFQFSGGMILASMPACSLSR